MTPKHGYVMGNEHRRAEHRGLTWVEIDWIRSLPGHGLGQEDKDPILRAYCLQGEKGTPMPPAEETHAWIAEMKRRK